MATSCEELTHWKRPWCWEGLGAGGEADDRGWDSWMASLTRWTWVWMNSGSWSWTGSPGMLLFMGLQRVGHIWATELNTSHVKKRPWCCESLKAGGEGDDRGWDGWMASLTRWTWAWASFRRWWTGKPGVLQSMGSQRVRDNWAT